MPTRTWPPSTTAAATMGNSNREMPNDAHSAPAGSMVIGGGGVETFVFRAEETGRIELEAEYTRPWEKNAKPAATQRFDITVR